jgi:hypothetical protein
MFSLIGCGVNEEEYVKFHEQGKVASSKLDQKACLMSAVENVKACDSIAFAVNTNGYLIGCFRNAKESSMVCTGVPEYKGAFKDEEWRTGKCIEAGADPTHCGILFGTLQRECH